MRRCPEVSFILDHIGKPGIKAGIREPWWSQMQELAELPNVICKISGVVTEADHKTWTYDQVAPYVARAIECFGFDRVAFGGDWPVSELATATPTGWRWSTASPPAPPRTNCGSSIATTRSASIGSDGALSRSRSVPFFARSSLPTWWAHPTRQAPCWIPRFNSFSTIAIVTRSSAKMSRRTATRRSSTPIREAVSRVADEVGPAVVRVDTRQRGAATGRPRLGLHHFPDGLIITNSHVVNGFHDIRLADAEGRTTDAQLIGEDPDTDIALIRANAARDLPTAASGIPSSSAEGSSSSRSAIRSASSRR